MRKRKREEAAKTGARTLFDVGLTKKRTTLSELSNQPASRPDESSTTGAHQPTECPLDKEPVLDPETTPVGDLSSATAILSQTTGTEHAPAPEAEYRTSPSTSESESNPRRPRQPPYSEAITSAG